MRKFKFMFEIIYDLKVGGKCKKLVVAIMSLQSKSKIILLIPNFMPWRRTETC